MKFLDSREFKERITPVKTVLKKKFTKKNKLSHEITEEEKLINEFENLFPVRKVVYSHISPDTSVLYRKIPPEFKGLFYKFPFNK
jgi:hypothetical protein